MDTEKKYKIKTLNNRILISALILFFTVLTQVFYVRELIFEQEKKSIAPQRLTASLDTAPKAPTPVAIFDCKTKALSLTSSKHSIRFLLENCPTNTKITNLTNGSEATVYPDNNAITTDFLGLNKGRNRILFVYNAERVEVLIITDL